MPKLDRQKRIRIPSQLSDKLSWTFPKDVDLCYNEQKNLIHICDKDSSTDEVVISSRNIDLKGRIYLPWECIRLLKASVDDLFILFLQNGQVFIKKA